MSVSAFGAGIFFSHTIPALSLKTEIACLLKANTITLGCTENIVHVSKRTKKKKDIWNEIS